MTNRNRCWCCLRNGPNHNQSRVPGFHIEFEITNRILDGRISLEVDANSPNFKVLREWEHFTYFLIIPPVLRKCVSQQISCESQSYYLHKFRKEQEFDTRVEYYCLLLGHLGTRKRSSKDLPHHTLSPFFTSKEWAINSNLAQHGSMH